MILTQREPKKTKIHVINSYSYKNQHSNTWFQACSSQTENVTSPLNFLTLKPNRKRRHMTKKLLQIDSKNMTSQHTLTNIYHEFKITNLAQSSLYRKQISTQENSSQFNIHRKQNIDQTLAHSFETKTINLGEQNIIGTTFSWTKQSKLGQHSISFTTESMFSQIYAEVIKSIKISSL